MTGFVRTGPALALAMGMNTTMNEAIDTLLEALEYLYSCPPYAIEAAELYVERCRELVRSASEGE